jgi:hypothetical protein
MSICIMRTREIPNIRALTFVDGALSSDHVGLSAAVRSPADLQQRCIKKTSAKSRFDARFSAACDCFSGNIDAQTGSILRAGVTGRPRSGICRAFAAAVGA